MSHNQKEIFANGNEAAALAAKQINYHVMGYYPITPSTRIVERLDEMKSEGNCDIELISAEGEHSAAGICYGASACGARTFNATSANGLLYSLEQLPVQSGTRMPMVLNVSARAVSGPLSIKCDHSDLMYALNTGWIILYAYNAQMVYDMNLCAIKIAEKCRLPVIVAFDGFFTSHQMVRLSVFEEDATVREFVGESGWEGRLLDVSHPVSIGSYMNEPDLINNKYQLHLAMQEAETEIRNVFEEYEKLSTRRLRIMEKYNMEDAEIILCFLGSTYQTARIAVDRLRREGILAGAFTLCCIRPFPVDEVAKMADDGKQWIIFDRQDSFGSGNGGNMSMEILAVLARKGIRARVYTRIYGIGGLDLYEEEICHVVHRVLKGEGKELEYLGVYPGQKDYRPEQFFEPISKEDATPDIDSFSAMPKRIAPGHGACPGCGIFVNVNLLLSGIEGNVVILFHTGCGMVVSTCYPKTAFRMPYIHNLFQNGPATMTGIVAAYHKMQERGEYPEGRITFVMVSGDGGMDIGMGSAIGAAVRDDGFILFEYDNGGYMNTGYQQSYTTPKGAKSKTSHVGGQLSGKTFYAKNTARIMTATGISYVATAAESHVSDFRKKAKKAADYAAKGHFVYMKCLSACPLNWQDDPRTERKCIEKAVLSCYFPLYEVENGKVRITVNPEKNNKKIPVEEWFAMMGRTKHLCTEKYRDLLGDIQQHTDECWERLKEAEN